MRPLLEKSAGSSPAKLSGKEPGFRSLGAILKQEINSSGLSGDAAVGHSQGCQAKVETVEEEGVVKKIVVRCSCGEVIEIDCQYGE